MKNILTKFAFILAIALLFTACPKPTGENDITDDSLTGRIAAAQGSIDFEGTEIAQNAEVSKAVTIKNLKLGGKSLTIKASGTELVNVSNAVIIIDQKVGDGDVTLTGCSNITKLVVNGGGSNSIHIKNSKVASVEVKKDAVRVAMEGNSEVEALVVDAAGTKIESEENIVIKSIAVTAGVDKVTVKGGTVETIAVAAPEGSQPSAQIVVDGKADIQSIEGTSEVTLTEEAVESGATVIIAPNEEVIPPTVKYENATLTFENDGSVEGTCFENTDYYYEYIFRIDSISAEMEQYKIKLYKLKDSIKLYLYTSENINGNPELHSQEYLNSETNSLLFDHMYDTTFILVSAGLVKGVFSEVRPNSSRSSYSKIFDIKNCGMPVKLVLPDNPDKPVVKIEATDQGNKIKVSHESIYYKRIDIYEAVKDSNNEWKPTNTKLFNFEDYNNQNPPASTSIVFLDSYVTPGKEYAYYVDTDKYDSTTIYYTSDRNPYIALEAEGGLNEISIKAENNSDGIKITVPYFPETDNTVYFDSLLRTSSDNKNTQHINNLNNLQGQKPVIDYFVNKGKQYTYSLDNQFYYKNENYRYHPHSNKCTIIATGGVGETIITNSPVVATTYGSVELTSAKTTIQFTTAPLLGISSIPDNFTIDIYFRYFKQLTEDSTSSESFTITYNPEATEVTSNASNLVEHYPNSTLKYDNFYEVFIKDNSTSVTYQYFVNNVHFDGLPEKLIIN